MNNQTTCKLAEVIALFARENRLDELDQLLMVFEKIDLTNELPYFPELIENVTG